MDQRKRELMQEQLRNLSYKNGEGIVAQIKRKMDASIRVLLVGFGGTGLDALECTMHELKQALDPEQYRNQVSVLAVDTSGDALYSSDDEDTADASVKKTEPKERFDRNTEWLQLPFQQAQQWKNNPAQIPGDMKEWVDPAVFSQATFSGQGASRIRQAGRVLLTQHNAAEDLVDKIRSKAGKLKNAVDSKLAVFVFSGIAGGTGSGCIVDGSYLIRHAVERVDPSASVIGYIFLPAVGAKVNTKNKANAYAALKEIAHYMTLEHRDEVFKQQYGALSVVSKKNIFTKCILLEGQVNGISASDFRECRTKAFHTAANTVLDNITAVPVKTAVGDTFHSIDEYIDNLNTDMIDMIAENRQDIAPRSAHYTFSVLGHASALVPIDLLKSYVMNQVFQRAMKLFRQCEDVKPEDTKKFLKECRVIGLMPEKYNQTKPRVEAYLKQAFKDINRGPYYVVNLLKDSAEYLSTSRKEDQQEMQRYLLRLNNNMFDVTVSVIKHIAEYLQEASGILTDTQLRESASGSRFSWMLVEFDSKTAQNKDFATQYLRTLINPKRINDLVVKLLDEMGDNMAYWSELTNSDTTGSRPPQFAAQSRLRQFIRDNVDGIVNGSIEDFLVRYYTNDVKARCTGSDGSVTESSRVALRKAAQEIIKEMFTSSAKAIPLAKFRDTNMIPLGKFPSKTFMYVPEAAPHLKAAIEELIKADSNLSRHVTVYSGTASDCIACYWRYDCLPAHQLEWVLEGEQAYEHNLKHDPTGLHLSQTVGGKQWKDLPNLCNEVVWELLEPGYSQDREAKLSKRTRDILKDAQKLGLTEERRGNANINICWLRLLPEDVIPAPIMFKSVDHETEGTVVHRNALAALEKDVTSKAQALFERLKPGSELLVTPISPECVDEATRQNLILRMEEDASFCVEQIRVGGDLDVMTPGPGYADNDPIYKTWTMDLAAELIRTRMDLMFRLRGNVLVMQKLAELVEENNKKIRHAAASANAIDEFLRYCATGILEYKEYDGVNEDGEEDTLYQWLYTDRDGNEAVLANLDPANALQMTAKHYYAFQNYLEMDEQSKKALAASYEEKTRTNRAKVAAQSQADTLKDILLKLSTSKEAPKAPEGQVSDSEKYFYHDAKLGMASAQFSVKIKNQELATEIRKFYKDIQNAGY